eukprot:2685842-Rhodomonas_salina.2
MRCSLTWCRQVGAGAARASQNTRNRRCSTVCNGRCSTVCNGRCRCGTVIACPRRPQARYHYCVLCQKAREAPKGPIQRECAAGLKRL